jgi:hypothetical protein
VSTNAFLVARFSSSPFFPFYQAGTISSEIPNSALDLEYLDPDFEEYISVSSLLQVLLTDKCAAVRFNG